MPSHKRAAGLRLLSAILPVCSILMVLICGCADPRAAGKAEQQAPPATVQNAPKEADLATITLTPQAEQRLGIALAPVSLQRVTRTRNFGADVVLPPDRRTVVTAPMSGTLLDSRSAPVVGMSVRSGQALYRLLPYLPPERYLRLQLESEVAAAETRVEAARVRSERADQLLRDQAGSEKAAQQAREELELARNDLKSARSRLERFVSSPLSSDTALTIAAPRDGMLQNVFVTPGQAVPAGAALFEVTDYSLMWIRVPVYVGELGQIDTGHYAVVRGLTDPPGRPGYRAKPVTAPPTADPNAATVDLYFELANQALKEGELLRPGQRLNATLALHGTPESLAVPWSAILHDANGGAWVYENIAPHVYTRRRVEVISVVNSLAILNRGPATGAKIVIAGAEELFGTEFGAGK